MTERLFWRNPYLRECDAIVTNINGRNIELDKSIIFVFSGGQASDNAWINGIRVVDSVENDKRLIYVLENDHDFKVRDLVKEKIDFEKRYKIMRLHSAIHIIYFLFYEKTGLKDLIGSNVYEDKARIDYETNIDIKNILRDIEIIANKIFLEDHEIKLIENEKRVWKCEDWECNCSGTHVKNTREIGNIILKRKNLGKNKERIEVTLS